MIFFLLRVRVRLSKYWTNSLSETIAIEHIELMPNINKVPPTDFQRGSRCSRRRLKTMLINLTITSYL